MKTSTMKQLITSIIVGAIAALALGAYGIMNQGIQKTWSQLLYIFVLMGGTFFVTGLISYSRGRDTKNMRIYAKKLEDKGSLKMNEQAELANPGKKNTRAWLYLTDKSLILATSGDPDLIEKTSVHIPFTKISKIDRYKPTALTNDGIRIKTTGGQFYEIMVGHTGKWIEEIENKKFRKNK